MIITLQLPSEVEEQLREGALRQDAQVVRQLLEAALAPAVEATVVALLRDTRVLAQSNDELTDESFDALTDELLVLSPALPSISDQGVSRASIYADHP